MVFRRGHRPAPKVEAETAGRTLIVRGWTKAHLDALFDVWWRNREDAVLSSAWGQITKSESDTLEHDFSAWGISSKSELKDSTACVTCGLAWKQHIQLRPAPARRAVHTPYAWMFNISEAQYASLSSLLERERPTASPVLLEAWMIMSAAQAIAPVHRFSTNEVDSPAELRFRADTTCMVCNLSLSRHAKKSTTGGHFEVDEVD